MTVQKPYDGVTVTHFIGWSGLKKKLLEARVVDSYFHEKKKEWILLIKHRYGYFEKTPNQIILKS